MFARPYSWECTGVSGDGFRLTYSTMFDPPPALHERFDAALARLREQLGRDHPQWIGGAPRAGDDRFEVRSPIDRNWLLGRFARGSAQDAADAVTAAAAASRGWAATPWRERVRLLRRVAALIEERVYFIGAAVALEVGKNRMESLGEVQETADLFTWYCDQMEANDGFDRPLPNDPLAGFVSRNRSVLKPYGAWAVIAPFNFPFALAGGPIAAALVAGNTVVFKTATDTAWSGWLLLEVLRDAGLPPGVVNYLSGAGGEVGAALIADARVAGATFTGSYEVGMQIVRGSRRGPGRGRASPRWAARTRRSSVAMRTWSARPPASSARPSACRGRSARHVRASTSSGRSPRRCARCWSRRRG
jgi:delta 1-pyrroline-5-carboxylate dehydrogenase